MDKIRLSWKAHVEAAPRHRSDFLSDVRDKAFDSAGDWFWMTQEDFEKVGAKHWIGDAGQSKISVPDVPSRGLGDSIAKVTSKMGIKKCGGCRKRQKKLNRLLPYR